MDDQPLIVPEWVCTLVGRLLLDAEALRRQIPLPTPSEVQCPDCGAWPSEWCDSSCALHRAGTCGLPHPTAEDGSRPWVTSESVSDA